MSSDTTTSARRAIICHGQVKSKAYSSWKAMKTRCSNPKHKQFKDYGGRGITVCARWQSFPNFFDDMGPCPPGHSLERRKNEQGYSPENCLWLPKKLQNRNRRDNRPITFNGETLLLVEWAERLRVPPNTLHARLTRLKWPLEKALTAQPRSASKQHRLLTHNGETLCLAAWARRVGLHPDTLGDRLKRMSLEAALSLPLRKRKG